MKRLLFTFLVCVSLCQAHDPAKIASLTARINRLERHGILSVTEQDLSPRVRGVRELRFTNTKVTAEAGVGGIANIDVAGVLAGYVSVNGTPNAGQLAEWVDADTIKGITVSSDATMAAGGALTIAANAVALTTDTTGNYVKDVADGTGIDGTASGEGATYTPSFDATELDALTWSDNANASNIWTFDVSGTDTTMAFGNGVITFGQVTAGVIPTAGAHLATKEYVDLSGLSGKDYWLSDTASGIGVNYVIYPTETGEGASTLVSAGETAGDDQLIFQWITEANEPDLLKIRTGTYSLHTHLNRGAGDPVTAVYFTLTKVDADGTSNETLLMTSEVSDNLGTSAAHVLLHANPSADVTMDATSRLIIKMYSNVTGGGTSNVTVTMEGAHDCHLSIQAPSSIWQNQGDQLDNINAGDAVTLTNDLTLDNSTPASPMIALVNQSDDVMEIGLDSNSDATIQVLGDTGDKFHFRLKDRGAGTGADDDITGFVIKMETETNNTLGDVFELRATLLDATAATEDSKVGFYTVKDGSLVLQGTIDNDGDWDFEDGNLTTTGTLDAANIAAFSLTGKLTAGATEIEGSAFDINGGTVDNISSLTASGNLDIGAHGFRALSGTFDGLTPGRVPFIGANGLITDNAAFTYSPPAGAFLTVSGGAIRCSGYLGLGASAPAPMQAGMYVGGQTDADHLDDSTHGSASTTMYIGDETIDTSPCDERMKINTTDSVIDAVSVLQQLQVKDTDWKSDEKQAEYGRSTVLIAQEVYEILPYCARMPADPDDNWSTRNNMLVPILVKALQEQDMQIKNLTERIEMLEK